MPTLDLLEGLPANVSTVLSAFVNTAKDVFGSDLASMARNRICSTIICTAFPNPFTICLLK